MLPRTQRGGRPGGRADARFRLCQRRSVRRVEPSRSRRAAVSSRRFRAPMKRSAPGACPWRLLISFGPFGRPQRKTAKWPAQLYSPSTQHRYTADHCPEARADHILVPIDARRGLRGGICAISAITLRETHVQSAKTSARRGREDARVVRRRQGREGHAELTPKLAHGSCECVGMGVGVGVGVGEG